MLCKCQWIVLYTVHFTAFCLGGPFFHRHGVYYFRFDKYHRFHFRRVNYFHFHNRFRYWNFTGGVIWPT